MKTPLKIVISVAAFAAAGFLRAGTAADNWENSCASCHGSDGKGQTKQGKKLKLRDYTDAKVQADLKDDEMLKAITDGVKGDNGKDKMKAFKEELSADEIKDLVAFVRKFKAS